MECKWDNYMEQRQGEAETKENNKEAEEDEDRQEE